MTLRIAAYIAGTAIAALALATLSSARLVAFQTIPSVALFAILLGLLQSGVAPALGRLPRASGCWPFAAAAFALNAAFFWLAGRALPGVTVTAAGALAGGAATAAAAAAVFTLLDERLGHE
ncbi:MAG: hypothetical protein ACKOWF_04570 [Chloroflexota bacterium]